MTAFWKAPSADYPYLELPILQKTKHINRHQIKRATQSSSLSVSPDFITVWNTAPRHVNCKKELTARLSILGLGLMALIVHAKKNLTVTKKTGSHDLVTEVDEGIEMLLRIWFQSHYPHHKLIGEEGHKAMITPDDIVWYIDPIDGTANFINHHPDYTIHIASVHQGRPYVLFFGIPERHLFYCSDEKKDAYSLKPCNNDDSICIGTEFFDFQTHKQTQLDSIQLQLQARSQRFKSIGIHIHNMLHQNSCSAFYKDQIKLWDLIAPLSLLYFYAPDQWEFNLFFTQQLPLTKKNMIHCSPFSNQANLLEHINQKHVDTHRIGLITITPKAYPKILPTILNEILK